MLSPRGIENLLLDHAEGHTGDRQVPRLGGGRLRGREHVLPWTRSPLTLEQILAALSLGELPGEQVLGERVADVDLDLGGGGRDGRHVDVDHAFTVAGVPLYTIVRCTRPQSMTREGSRDSNSRLMMRESLETWWMRK